jgi:hypothetical protein
MAGRDPQVFDLSMSEVLSAPRRRAQAELRVRAGTQLRSRG